ncbi:hypothetical protein [Sedimentitalea nanhaiensis]|uniref:Uncharacterized protein n=1 Tax=Sedimentitalea nanhaiensis TaxID=999627 RepID=A0A1I7C7H9_9RHOB|nr:hypothetical protein [Sedimentitalea nanhaiensis]SFT95391.1 hypothetical protein SAMN05216236_1158 [Sedimentitalea nanhaiensis]
MELIADILMVAGALGAGFYCFILARRLNRFNNLEKGVGGAVAVLSAQVDDLNSTLIAARDAADNSNASLTNLTVRAESVAARLELLMASMHDIPEAEDPKPEAETAKPVEAKPKQQTAPTTAGPMFMRHERTNQGIAQ